MTPIKLRKYIKKLPKKPGIYIFSAKGEKIYIGKALDLRARVSNYLKSPDQRIQRMVLSATALAHEETTSEIEALILESQSIKKWQPKYNIMLRDDKHYYYVAFSNDKFPQIYLTHNPYNIEKSNIKIRNESKIQNPNNKTPSDFKFRISDLDPIGPFTENTPIKTTLKLLRRIFPYCTCKQKHNNYCLNYHIGKCPGYCCLKKVEGNKVLLKKQEEEYEKNIKAIKEILSGKRQLLIKGLKKEMKTEAAAGNFDKAIILRNQLGQVERMFENAKVVNSPDFKIRSAQRELIELKESLYLPTLPLRIEGYDISNIQGTNATGSMVVFTNGLPDKNQYRKFKIQSVKGVNDTAMLSEVLLRRFNHPEWPNPDLIIIDGGRAQLNAAITITLNLKSPSFAKACATAKALGDTRSAGRQISPASPRLGRGRANLKEIKIISLTKNEKHFGHHIFTPKKKHPILLERLPHPVKNLILRIDSEAHRFAISYYRKLHKNRILI